MSRSRKLLCMLYAAIAALAFVGTWKQNLHYFHAEDGPIRGFANATARFWSETLVSPASTSITVDIGLFMLAASFLMVIEARRLGIRFVWAYIVLGLLVAISVTFPLFLIARERRITATGTEPGPLNFKSIDTPALAALTLSAVIITLWTALK
jgi:hypothetical protein